MSQYSRLSSASTSSWQEPDDPASQLNFEELIEEEKEEKNWKGIGIALLVIVVVFSCVSVAVVIVTPEKVVEREGAKLSLEDLLKGHYEPYVLETRWSKDGKNIMYKTKDNELVYFECESNYSSVFLDSSPFNEFSTKQYLVSPDKSFVLFPHNTKRISQHSFLTRYKLYDTDTRLSRDLLGPQGHEFEYVLWTNNGQGLIAVQKNNIYFKPSFSPKSPYITVTSSGKPGVIYNGVPDWLYSEEVFKSNNAVWLSPDDDYLVYVEFNDSHVEEMSYTTFDDPTQVYPNALKQRYPKFGTKNPTIRLKAFNFRTNVTVTLPPPSQFIHRDHYITSITWRNSKQFAAIWLNREQNTSIISICDASTAFCYDNLMTETHYGWLDLIDSVIFTPTGSHYFISTPRQGEKGKLVKQVLMVDASVNIKLAKIRGRTLFLTTGDVEIVRPVGYFNKSVYVLGIPLADPRQRHLYMATIDKDSSEFHELSCVTCDINDNCLYVDVKFEVSGNYYVLECLGPGVPYYDLYATPTNFVTRLENNSHLHKALSGILIPDNDFLNVSLPDGNFVLSKLILPPVLDPEELIQYNVIIIPNDDIGVQTATHKFQIGWEHFMSSFHSIIIAKVDTSGSSGRGDNWKKSVYRNVGSREVDEILAVVRSLKGITYVNHVMGVVGKGYGGHVALSSLSSDFNDGLTCGVAITPVIDFSYMDSFVTERYYGNGEYHIISHNEIKLLKNIKNMQSHRLLLMHGTLNATNFPHKINNQWWRTNDVGHIVFNQTSRRTCLTPGSTPGPYDPEYDKIHFQNTAQYIKALVGKNIRHELQIYPDSFDCLDDPLVRHHVITSIENFFINCFGIDPNKEPSYFDDGMEED